MLRQPNDLSPEQTASPAPVPAPAVPPPLPAPAVPPTLHGDAWRREAVIVIDHRERVVEWNAAAQLIFGFEREEVRGRRLGALIVPTERVEENRARWQKLAAPEAPREQTFPRVVLLARGEQIPVSARVTRTDTTPPSFVISVRDLTGREPTEEVHRQLTAIVESAEDAIATLRPDGTITSWNRAAERMCGYRADEVVGRRMGTVLVPSDRAHEPGEWLRMLSNGETIERETERLHKSGAKIWVALRMMPVRDDEGRVTGGIWIARDVTDRHRLEEHEQLDRDARRWRREISRALAEDLFVFAAQPIIDLRTGALDHFELLLRMRRGGELASAGEFLMHAEHSGQIAEIDRWGIGAGIAQAKEMPVAINLSGASVSREGTFAEIEQTLRREGVPPAMVTFELTETVAAEDIERAAELVGSLAELGCRIALDDFGTGFGTFTYLSRLPVNELKIDREFVAPVCSSATDARVVRTMVAVAENFGMKTVAEGIEDEPTLETLKELGVDLGQGYLLGRPAPIDEVSATGGGDDERA